MSDQEREQEPLSEEDLDVDGEPLPDRDATSILPVPDPFFGGNTLPVEPPAQS